AGVEEQRGGTNEQPRHLREVSASFGSLRKQPREAFPVANRLAEAFEGLGDVVVLGENQKRTLERFARLMWTARALASIREAEHGARMRRRVHVSHRTHELHQALER